MVHPDDRIRTLLKLITILTLTHAYGSHEAFLGINTPQLMKIMSTLTYKSEIASHCVTWNPKGNIPFMSRPMTTKQAGLSLFSQLYLPGFLEIFISFLSCREDEP